MGSIIDSKKGYGGIDASENYVIDDESDEDENVMVENTPISRREGEEGGWLHVPGSESRDARAALDEEEGPLRPNRQSLELDADDDDDEEEEEEYDLTDAEAHDPPTEWRPKERMRCIAIIALTFIIASATAVFQQSKNKSSFLSRPPPGAVGVGHSAYDALHSSWLKEYEARLTLYRHRATGAEFLAFVPDSTRSGPGNSGRFVEGDDTSEAIRGSGGNGEVYDPRPDRVFGVAFRTKPETSTGVPHILEHSVLCGSRKYPSRDPFAYLLKGSLQTFLNAMTYPDRTVYPVASRNRADFRNLMDVYLDAVFHPRAIEDEGWWVLRQEGWRYDVVGSENGDDDSKGPKTDEKDRVEFEYKGVVYSEMKGAYSDPEGYIERITQSLLFPDNSYHFDSGGDPAIIPTLTREEFVAFYKKYYHPTNARLFVAGDESDVYHALSSADHYMSPMGYRPESRKDSTIAYQKRTFKSPLRERRHYAVAAGEDDDDGANSSGYMLCVTWLLNTQPFTPMMELAWIVLDYLLLGKTSSPLTKALENSDLGEEIIGDGLDNELLQSTFAVGMRGLKQREDVAALEKVIMDTLHQLETDGFSDDDMASSINTVEFKLREGGGGLRGLEIFLSSLTKWNYGLSPKDALVYEDALTALKSDIDKTGSNIFQKLIRDFLISNNHRVVLEMQPSTTLEAEQLQDTKIQLSRAESSMSDEEYKHVIEEGIKLKEFQASEETPDVIASNPTLSISDIDSLSIEYPIRVEQNAFKSGVRMITHEVRSSGIIYVDFGLDVSMIPYDDLVLLPALVNLMNEAGTSDMSDIDFRNMIGKVTGGVTASLQIMSVKPEDWDDESKVLPGVNMLTMLFVRGKCTSDKVSDLFSLFEKILKDIDIENSQDILRNIMKSKLSSMKSTVASRGHSYVDRRIRGRYSPRNFIEEKMYGVTHLKDTSYLLDVVEKKWPMFVLRLKKMRQAILNGNRNGMLLNLTGDGSVLDAVMTHVENFLVNKLPVDLGNPAPPTPEFRSVDHPWIASATRDMSDTNPVQDEGIVVSTQVAYVGEGGRLYDVGDDVSGSTSVVSHYLTTGYMWDTIRAKNGAYGAYSKFSHSDGISTLFTYRDPNLPDETLKAFHDAADDILQATTSSLIQNDNAAITMAVIGTIGSLDGSALSAEDVGWVSLLRWMRGESSISRQRWRNDILNTNVDDFIDYANRLKSWKDSSVAIVASQSSFDGMQSRGVKLSLLKAQ